MNLDTTQIIVLGSVGVFVVLLVAVALSVRRIYQVPRSNEAIVRTGMWGPAAIVGGGAIVLPVVHHCQRLSLEAVNVNIDRKGNEALRSRDKLLADVEGRMLVQVDPEKILLAAQSLGDGTTQGIETAVLEKTSAIVTDAMRSATMKKTFLELNVEKEEFSKTIQDGVADDLAKLGLKLISVTITEVRQLPFAADDESVFTAEGRRNAAEVVEKNRQETNQIQRQAQVEVHRQDVEARKRALELERTQKELEADQSRQVTEYEAQQETERKKAIFLREQEAAEAEQRKAEAIERARILQEQAVRETEISRETQIALREAEAQAKKAQADADRAVAEERAAQLREAAEIERQRAVKVAEEARQQAIEEAEVARQVAIAQRRAEEAAARASQATAEANQREAEEAIVTVKEKAEAERARAVALVRARELAEKEQIKADQDAYVLTRRAEADRDAVAKRAEAAELQASGVAKAQQATAEGEASSLLVRANAEAEAAAKQAEAKKLLADAVLAEGRARAEARRLEVEAENAIADKLVVRDVAVTLLEQAPAIVHEVMAPVAKVAHDVKILQVQGMGGGGEGEARGLPATILQTGLAAAGVAPFLKAALGATRESPELRQVADALQALAGKAVSAGAAAVTDGVGAVDGDDDDDATVATVDGAVDAPAPRMDAAPPTA